MLNKTKITFAYIFYILLLGGCNVAKPAIDLATLPIKIVSGTIMGIAQAASDGSEKIAETVDDRFPHLRSDGRKRLVLIGKEFVISKDMRLYKSEEIEISSDIKIDASKERNLKNYVLKDQQEPSFLVIIPKGTTIRVVKITSDNFDNKDFPYEVYARINNPQWKDSIVNVTEIFKPRILRALKQGYLIDQTPPLHYSDGGWKIKEEYQS